LLLLYTRATTTAITMIEINNNIIKFYLFDINIYKR
jgi:hypothetical protein